MLITHEREKLLNAIVYFSENVNFFGKIKLFKLLYFFDFEHYKLTGRSVTGLDYFAWDMGPVPKALFEELESPKPDFLNKIQIKMVDTKYDRPMLCLSKVANTSFESSFFSKRELQILKSLVSKYKNFKADEMVEDTHLENLPWDKIYNQLNQRSALIPYELALRNQEKERMLKLVNERNAFIQTLK